jgi:hypothetical protein
MKPTHRLSLFGTALPAIVSALVLGNAWAQTPPPTLVLSETNNEGTVGAVLQQPISVHLRGNATTPYAWFFVGAGGTSVVTNGPADYVPDSPGLPGSAGTFEFPFLAADAGTTTLSFSEHLHGNPQDVLATFVVSIEVTVPQPTLSIALVGTEVLITWPNTTSSEFFLEGTPNLTPPHWAALNVLVQDDGQNYWVRLGHSGPPLFFRLHRS